MRADKEKWFSPEGRIIGLDILRGLAIAIVVYVHGALLVPQPARKVYLSGLPIKLDGVSVFFVLSGFLIGGILIRTLAQGKLAWRDWRAFLMRRWFRTLPNYLLVLTGLVVYLKAFDPQGLKHFQWSYFFFGQNLTQPHPYFFPEAWSLAVEEWFYLLFPLACWAMARWRGWRGEAVAVPAALFLLVPLGWRWVTYREGMDPELFDRGIRKVVAMRLDALMFGVVAAYVQWRWKEGWLRWRKPGLVLGTGLLAFFYFDAGEWKGAFPPLIFVWESLAVLAFLPYLSQLRTTGWKGLDRGIVFLSVISYSLYLLHLTPVLHHVLPAVGAEQWPAAGAWTFYVGVSVLASFVLYAVFERPTTRLRDRWWA
ncbi:MAG: hypothetical protein RJA19_872 [Bacteroidota bacterium]